VGGVLQVRNGVWVVLFCGERGRSDRVSIYRWGFKTSRWTDFGYGGPVEPPLGPVQPPGPG
jgi:hypothetical protein